MSKANQGHPAKQDPNAQRLFKTIQVAMDLVRDLDGRISDENHVRLRASVLGLMYAYSDLTGQKDPELALEEMVVAGAETYLERVGTAYADLPA